MCVYIYIYICIYIYRHICMISKFLNVYTIKFILAMFVYILHSLEIGLLQSNMEYAAEMCGTGTGYIDVHVRIYLG